MGFEGKNRRKDTKKAVTFKCNCLIFKWCHQESQLIHKWLYIITFQKHQKSNLLLLLHRWTSAFCVSLQRMIS